MRRPGAPPSTSGGGGGGRLLLLPLLLVTAGLLPSSTEVRTGPCLVPLSPRGNQSQGRPSLAACNNHAHRPRSTNHHLPAPPTPPARQARGCQIRNFAGEPVNFYWMDVANWVRRVSYADLLVDEA